MNVEDFYDEHYQKHIDTNSIDTLPQAYIDNLDKFGEQLPESPVIIDAGCGNGRDGEYLQSEWNAAPIGIDISQKMLNTVPFQTYNTSIESIHMIDVNSVDGYWCPSTLYFLLDPNDAKTALNEAHRVLTSNGIGFFGFKVISKREDDTGQITEMNRWGDTVKFRQYSISEVKSLMDSTGFEISSEVIISPDERTFYNIFVQPTE